MKALFAVIALMLLPVAASAACVWCNPCMSGCYIAHDGAAICNMWYDACDVDDQTRTGIVCDFGGECHVQDGPPGGSSYGDGGTTEAEIRPMMWNRLWDWYAAGFGHTSMGEPDTPGGRTNGDPDVPVGPTFKMSAILIEKDGIGVQAFASVASGEIPDGVNHEVRVNGSALFTVESRDGDLLVKSWDGVESCLPAMSETEIGSYRVIKRVYLTDEAGFESLKAALFSLVRGRDLSLSVVKGDAVTQTRHDTWGSLKLRYR